MNTEVEKGAKKENVVLQVEDLDQNHHHATEKKEGLEKNLDIDQKKQILISTDNSVYSYY